MTRPETREKSIIAKGSSWAIADMTAKAMPNPYSPFGHGLSYTTFDYSGLKVMRSGDGLDVTFVVTNTGTRKGSEIAQVYIEPCDSSRPVKELKGFAKLELAPGESRRVTIKDEKCMIQQLKRQTQL